MTMMAPINQNQTVREIEMLLNQNDALAEEMTDNRRMIRNYIAGLESSIKETNNNREEVVSQGSVIATIRGQQNDKDEEATPDVEETHNEEENPDVEETQEKDESTPGIEEIGDVSETVLKAKLKTLEEKVKISAKNLEDQKTELKMMENRKGRYVDVECKRRYVEWKEQAANVKRYILIHKRFVDDTNKRIGDINRELKKLELSKRASKKCVLSGPGPRASMSSSNTSSVSKKRKLDESVIDCGMMRKVSAKEMDAMEISYLKKEEEPCKDTFECNYCDKSFTSAGPLAAHLMKHTDGSKNTRLDCPWSYCAFSNTLRNLIKHMRSKHTKEELFKCGYCPAKFHTMDAKEGHVKKHRQSNMWQQCGDCLRFYQVARGSCTFCKK